ncbi:hypothetical protein LCGC14_2243860 [marine sediment metagenome]|uniref:Uncharacterized protein n=1 Tax=marine sediment metagenome TaxID=412755 RepID=A0A0F9FH53_9ZZZZ
MCEHKDFKAKVIVARFKDTGGFMAEIRINCQDCGKPFQFLGLEPGVDTCGATVSIDGFEARIAIAPEGTRPSPLLRMAFGIDKVN